MYTHSWMIWKWKAGDTWKLTLASPTCAFLWATFPSPRARPRSWKNSVKLQVTHDTPQSISSQKSPTTFFFVFFNPLSSTLEQKQGTKQTLFSTSWTARCLSLLSLGPNGVSVGIVDSFFSLRLFSSRLPGDRIGPMHPSSMSIEIFLLKK